MTIIYRFGGKKEAGLKVAMSLLSVGPVMFGGTGRIVSYLRARHLLAANKNCTRCMQIVIFIGSLRAIRCR